VRSWLACGDPVAAVELGLRVAKDAAALGEPEAGAVLLSRIPRTLLQPEQQRDLLDTIIELADIGKCPSLMRETLSERAILALHLSESHHSIMTLTMRVIASDLVYHQNYHVTTLTRLIGDPSLPPELHIDACAWVLAAADVHMDGSLAEYALHQLSATVQVRGEEHTSYLRGMLIYHTTFGDQDEAVSRARSLFARFPEPSIIEDVWRSRAYATFSLYRIGYYSEAAVMARRDWEYMHSVGHLKGADYFASLSMEAYLSSGDAASAEPLLHDLQKAISRRTKTEEHLTPAYYSAAIYLAIASGNYDDAERLITTARRVHGGLLAPRLKCARLSYELHLQLVRDSHRREYPELDELRRLFEAGKRLGGVDYTAAVLYQVLSSLGRNDEASELLNDYLTGRRELGTPEFVLQEIVAKDRTGTGRRRMRNELLKELRS
jgi:hypothetical protein